RTTLMAASPCGPWFIPRAQRSAHLYRGRKVFKWNFGTRIRVAFAYPSNRVSHSRTGPSSCESDAAHLRLASDRLSAYGAPANGDSPKFPSRRRAGSNDQCEQFDDAYSDHQHSKGYRVVIEPMRPLHIHRRPRSVPSFELLDKCSHMRGHRRGQSVILGPEAVPN